MIPAFVAATVAGQTLTVHGDGKQTRDFTSIDSLTAVIADGLERRVISPAPVNLAFGAKMSLLDLVVDLEEISGRALRCTTSNRGPAMCVTRRPTAPSCASSSPTSSPRRSARRSERPTTGSGAVAAERRGQSTGTCRLLLNVRVPSAVASTTTTSPSWYSPLSSASAIGSLTSRWSTRLSGRAPKSGS